MSKYLYPIYKLKIKSYIRWWLYNYLGKFNNYFLSEILTGTSFYLEDSIDRKFNVFDMIGRTTQESTTGKNLLPQGINYTESFSNRTITSKDGIYSITGTGGGTSQKINLIEGYTIQSGDYLHIMNDNITFEILGYKSNGDRIFDIVANVTNRIISLENYVGTTLSSFAFYINNNQTNTFKLTPMIVNNISTATDYEPYTGGEPAPNPKYPYAIKNTGDNGSVNEKVSNLDGTQEQNISFPLAQGQKLMQGDYPDDDEKVHHKWGEIILDGTVGGYNADYNWFYLSFTNLQIQKPKTLNILSNYFKYYNRNEFAKDTSLNGISFNTADISTASTFVIRNTNCTNATEYKNWLAEVLPKVIYELAEETTEDFTSAQQTAWEQIKALRTYKNVTHITSSDETPALLKIQYWKEG